MCQKISQMFIVLGVYNFEPCAENPSSLVFHAAKKRWQVYYLASRAARIIIIVQLGTEKNEPPRVQFSCGSILTYSWVGPKINWRHSGWIFTVGVFETDMPLVWFKLLASYCGTFGTFDLTAMRYHNKLIFRLTSLWTTN